jgi:hypothetical protein
VPADLEEHLVGNIISKNRATKWRDAQKAFSKDPTLQEVDAIVVVETCMRYYFALGQKGLELDMPVSDVRSCFKEALAAASIVLPYRHPRLSAVKHVDAAVADLAGIPKDATAEELRAELAKRIAQLRDKGYVDLEALPPPKGNDGGE